MHHDVKKRYGIGKKLGAGVSAEVFMAYDKVSGGTLAMKKIPLKVRNLHAPARSCCHARSHLPDRLSSLQHSRPRLPATPRQNSKSLRRAVDREVTILKRLRHHNVVFLVTRRGIRSRQIAPRELEDLQIRSNRGRSRRIERRAPQHDLSDRLSLLLRPAADAALRGAHSSVCSSP